MLNAKENDLQLPSTATLVAAILLLSGHHVANPPEMTSPQGQSTSSQLLLLFIGDEEHLVELHQGGVAHLQQISY